MRQSCSTQRQEFGMAERYGSIQSQRRCCETSANVICSKVQVLALVCVNEFTETVVASCLSISSIISSGYRFLYFCFWIVGYEGRLCMF